MGFIVIFPEESCFAMSSWMPFSSFQVMSELVFAFFGFASLPLYPFLMIY
jgi:hypothetical protein